MMRTISLISGFLLLLCVQAHAQAPSKADAPQLRAMQSKQPGQIARTVQRGTPKLQLIEKAPAAAAKTPVTGTPRAPKLEDKSQKATAPKTTGKE